MSHLSKKHLDLLGYLPIVLMLVVGIIGELYKSQIPLVVTHNAIIFLFFVSIILRTVQRKSVKQLPRLLVAWSLGITIAFAIFHRSWSTETVSSTWFWICAPLVLALLIKALSTFIQSKSGVGL